MAAIKLQNRPLANIRQTVSIVVPCYNGGKFLKDLTTTILRQTHKALEVIIVDDGSNDILTLELLDRLPAHFRIIKQENRGLAAARNVGFKLATSPYILPLDCDDLLHPEFIAKHLDMLISAEEKVGFVFSDMRLFGAFSGILPRQYNLFDQCFLNQLPYCMLFRRHAWLSVGGYDETMRDGYEDWEFNLRLGKAGYYGLALHEPLFFYRVSRDGMLYKNSAPKHAKLWRYMRSKHEDLFQRHTLAALHSHYGKGRISWPLALALLVSTKMLPDSLFGWLFTNSVRLNQNVRFKAGQKQNNAHSKLNTNLSGNKRNTNNNIHEKQ